ncbi:hypothetical protein NDK50_08125 [Paraburkholderia bryophila]|uniref:hypothetical protein n=1 Tax=Paraburkholderia bryophila TaxID=420952 RepID=UPI00234BC804|nr:hypothetical protein [Paraburkholderia bryophila]WCM21403.1 hypothetical protein NDK50_08125 [Paraburkholderia bryophila]
MTYDEAKKICEEAFAELRRQGTKDIERAVVMRAINDSDLMRALRIVESRKFN